MSPTEIEQDPAFEALLDYLKRNRGFDFRAYKRSSLMRRVRKRMQMVNVESFEDYIDYLEVQPDEFTHLFNTILINVTSFYRDAPAWDYLVQEIIPQIIAGKGADEPVRVWSAGCASGEEAYTLAIVLAEALGPEFFRQRVKIYATDVDEAALAEARHATYPSAALQALTPELWERYFEVTNSGYTFRNDLRRCVIFGRNDLIQDAPISRLDLLVCRNTFMYFNAEAQARILVRFHFALNENGYLFLGKAEMLLTHTDLFTPVEMKHRIFTKAPKGNLRERLLTMGQAGNNDDYLARQVRLREMAFDSTPVAQVVIDRSGSLVMANEQARSFFNLHLRDLGRPLQDLELSYRPVELRSSIDQATIKRRAMHLRNVERHWPNAPTQYFDIQVLPLWDNYDNTLGISITFNDVTPFRQLQEELQHSNEELETAYEELQSTNEELETTNEELQSTNEELETTNEELQSTNEELEMMNEELQSTNEALQTMNDELRLRTDELDEANAFLNSTLASLRAGVVVVDRALKVITWNGKAEDLWGLRADEVQGKPFLSLDSGLPVAQLADPIRACLAGESDYQEVVLHAINRRGKAIQCRITCSPLIGADRARHGTILLMEAWGGDVNER